MGTTYVESFSDGPGGWYGWDEQGAAALTIRDGAAVSRSPWWVDYNHAPPGGGYLHILFALNTRDGASTRHVAGENRFVSGRFPTDFTGANISVRIRGDLDQKDARVVLLAQADIVEPVRTRVNSVLAAQPLIVTREWSEQSLTCAPDNGQWQCLGSRHDRMDTYGWGPIAPVLRDVNLDIIFVLFPLDVVPTEALPGDIHLRRAGRDFTVDRSRLPVGEVMLDEVRIEFGD